MRSTKQLQAAAEAASGIDEKTAMFINTHRELPEVKNALGLLMIQSVGYDPAGMALLEQAVRQVKAKMVEIDGNRQ